MTRLTEFLSPNFPDPILPDDTNESTPTKLGVDELLDLLEASFRRWELWQIIIQFLDSCNRVLYTRATELFKEATHVTFLINTD